MLVIENCNSLSDLRQKLIDGEEVRTVRDKPCEDAIRREDAINAVSEALEHVVVENEDVARKMINKLPSVKPQEPCEDVISRQAVVGYLCTHCPDDAECFEDCDDIKNIKSLPPVNPQPKEMM